MYERMTDKAIQPELCEIRQYIGEKSWGMLQEFETLLRERYDVSRELRYPFGKAYGWGYKYSHRTKHLCYLFFEKDAITLTFQIGDKEVPVLCGILPELSDTARALWEKRYPCGENGGWIHFRILTMDDLSDAVRMIEVRKKPPRR